MKNTLLTGLLLSLGLLGYSQKSPKEIKGDKYFEKLDYSRAITKYEALDSSLTTEGLRNLAESYRLTFKTDEAENAYETLVNKSDAQPQDIYYYSYVLKENQKYLESNNWMLKFQTLASTNDLRVSSHKVNSSNINKLLVDNGQFTIKNLDINSSQEDFGTSFYKDQVVFASSREGSKFIKRKWNGNNLPFLDLYTADRDLDNSELSELDRFSKVTNKKYHEGPASFAKDGNYMAFTRNSYTGKSTDGTIKLQIFFSEKDSSSNKWSDPVAFHKNDEEYSIGHPFLTEDGNTMYFASDMPGGYGMADLYKVSKNGEGNWGEPVNLGKNINTEGNEMFPFYHEAEQLLFLSSDGHTGLGGLDLFVSPDQDGYSKIHNLGSPMNSSTDDFALVGDKELKTGYLSSNRDGGKGDDDIYSFSMLKPFVFGKKIEGIAKDKKGNVLSGVAVNLFENGKVVNTATTKEDGSFGFSVESDKNFTLDGNKDKYFPGNNSVSSKTDKDVIKTDLTLEKDPGLALHALVTDSKTKSPLEAVNIKITDNFTGETFINETTNSTGDVLKGISGKKIGERLSYNIALSKAGYFPKTVTFNTGIEKPGTIDVHNGLDLSMDKAVEDLSELVQINPIKFDLNKYNIRPDAEVELNKIVEVMNKYPNMIVELGAHTDCRGSAKYNEKLSDNRAKSSATYIKSKITNPSHISGKGYGEQRILNGCECEGSKRSTCTQEQHSENRRTEFKVISSGSDNLEVKNTSTDSFDK